MTIQTIDEINKMVLLCVFLIGMLSGGVIGVIVSALTTPKRDDRKE